MVNKKSELISRYFRYQIDDIRIDMQAIEQNALLPVEKNFDKRTDAIDFIDFHIIGRIEGLLHQTDHSDELILLRDRARKAKADLEVIDAKMFQKLQDNIRNRSYISEDFKALIYEYVCFDLEGTHQQEAGYDNLDVFINGLFSFQDMPEQTRELEPGMVFYQKTPACIVFEMVEKIDFSSKDVFFDLGSGLGHVAKLVNLLTGTKTVGIEFEAAFCKYAEDCAANLNLSGVEFINTDARKADYSAGTIFFMYTPFNDKILQDVLEALRKESLLRRIKIVTYGPCTAEVASQSWLSFADAPGNNTDKLAVFTSLQA